MDLSDISFVAGMDEVRAQHPAMMSRASDKVMKRLDQHCRRIIERSTFCVIATHGRAGADVSPRGDPAGFLKVLDDSHLLLPDRIGNISGMANQAPRLPGDSAAILPQRELLDPWR